MNRTIILLLFVFLTATSFAETQRATTFPESLTLANSSTTPIAVYIHGSSWQRASERFLKSTWLSDSFPELLSKSVILTEIEIPQNLEGETAKAYLENLNPWKSGTVRSFPAIQIYAPDGHLLKTIQGGAFRDLASPEATAAAIDEVAKASVQRTALLEDITKSREKRDKVTELAALSSLANLPLNPEPKFIDMLKVTDPDDNAGLQAQLSFKDWWFVREINGMITKGETAEALTRIDTMLADDDHPAEQRIFIIGARGNVLVAQEKLEEAWDAFQKAHDINPEDPNAIAMRAHGMRVAGIPSRRVLPEGSLLERKDIGDLLTTNATFTQSSAAFDETAQPASLFTGKQAEFAFHTDNEKGAHIIIDLQRESQIRGLRITNRQSQSERSNSLTVWYSTGGKDWTQLWSAGEVEPAWEILPKAPVNARYVKIGLQSDVSNFLHLRAVDIYGAAK